MLGKAIPAIDGPALGGLEGYFTFFTAVGASGLVHFPWAEVSRTPESAVSH